MKDESSKSNIEHQFGIRRVEVVTVSDLDNKN